MKYRKHKDFTLSEVGVGCYALSGVYGVKDVKEFKQRQVLSKPLPKESSKDFVNLVYVIETSILLGLTSEKEVLPIFQELYGMRKTLSEDAVSKLENIRKRLCDITHAKNGEIL